jgi:hypothetical protein
MTVGGELRLLVPGHTWRCSFYIIELEISELGKIQNGFPISLVLEILDRGILGNDFRGWIPDRFFDFAQEGLSEDSE